MHSNGDITAANDKQWNNVKDNAFGQDNDLGIIRTKFFRERITDVDPLVVVSRMVWMWYLENK